MRSTRALPLLAALLLALPAAGGSIELQLVDAVDVPGFSIEIIQYDAPRRLLLATNPHWKTLDVFDVESLDPPRLHARDFDDETPDAQGLFTVYEPTSVALHPTQPVALVATIGRAVDQTGRVLGFDLRDGSFGSWVLNLDVGFHPDSIAVAPDGRWALVACEAEGNPDAPGSIWAIDLSNLSADTKAKDQHLPAMQIGDLSKLLRVPAGDVEPEFVGFDPQSRFAVVSCQENNGVVWVDLRDESGPKLAGFTALSPDGEPDGVAVLDNVPHPDDPARLGCLVAVAEEGAFNKFGKYMGQFLTLLWVDPDRLDDDPVFASSTHIPTALGDMPDTRRDPENLIVTRRGGRIVVVLTVERGDMLLAFDATDPANPVLCSRVGVGDSPEGVILVETDAGPMILTGDEGHENKGPGTVSFTRLRVGER